MLTFASKYFPRTSVTPDDFVWKQDNWVNIIYLRHVAIVTARDG